MKVSIVIITWNRAKYLKQTLTALEKQTFKDYEIIVVNGPSTDNTKEVALSFPVKYFETTKANISVSRNIGIKNALGDIIFFIDDDAIPHDNCLEEIAKQFEKLNNQNIGGIAGRVFDETGKVLQFSSGFVGIWAEINMLGNPQQSYNDPKGYYFNTTIGVNSAFSKEALLAIGGFDEEFEYHLDESDVCVRMIKAGYKIIPIDKVIVFHKYAPSSIRDDNKQITSWNKIAKNSIYFAIKNSADYAPLYLRILKPLTLELDKFKKISNLKLGFVKAIKKYIELIFWMLKGYFRGLFAKRKLLDN